LNDIVNELLFIKYFMKLLELKIFFTLNELSLKVDYKIFFIDHIKIFSGNRHQGNLKNNFL